MGSLYFILVAVVLYVAADWILKRAESMVGRRFEDRTIIFFVILLGLAFVSFAILRNLLGVG